METEGITILLFKVLKEKNGQLPKGSDNILQK